MTTEPPLQQQTTLFTLGRQWRRRPARGLPPGAHLANLSDSVQYKLAPAARQLIDDHVHSTTQVEVGGVLLGKVYQENALYFVCIETVLPARFTSAGPAHVTFAAATWLDFRARRAQLSGVINVGWYHSHPGFGVFLSGSDLYIQHHYFGDQPWYIGLVVDPIAEEWGAFGWREGSIVRLPDPPADLSLPEEST